jgi:hypothetical protein
MPIARARKIEPIPGNVFEVGLLLTDPPSQIILGLHLPHDRLLLPEGLVLRYKDQHLVQLVFRLWSK